MCDLLVIPFSSDSEELSLVPVSVLVCDSLVILDSGELSLVPAAGLFWVRIFLLWDLVVTIKQPGSSFLWASVVIDKKIIH